MTTPKEWFDLLLDRLDKCNAVITEAEKNKTTDIDRIRLEQAHHALRSVIQYIHGDERARENGSARCLSYLFGAVHDSTRGAKPPLFDQPVPDERPAGTNTPAPTKPSGTISEQVQAHLAFALEALCVGKHGTDDAAKWLADECRRQDVRTSDGQPIAAKQIDGWRKNINRKRASAVAIEWFDVLNKKYRPAIKQLPHTQQFEHAERIATTIVKNLSNLAARNAPDQGAPRGKIDR